MIKLKFRSFELIQINKFSQRGNLGSKNTFNSFYGLVGVNSRFWNEYLFQKNLVIHQKRHFATTPIGGSWFFKVFI